MRGGGTVREPLPFKEKQSLDATTFVKRCEFTIFFLTANTFH